MLTAAILKALQVYGIAIAISAIVAILIKVLVAVTGKMEKAKPVEVPIGSVCPVGIGVPDEDVAALSAAIFTVIGPHHILHIGQSRQSWSSGGRAALHSSHLPGPAGRSTR